MGGRKRIEDSEVIQGRMMQFAQLFCLFSVKNTERSKNNRQIARPTYKASKAMGISQYTGEQWIKNPIVTAEIKRILTTAEMKAGMNPESVLTELSLIAISDTGKYFEKEGEDGLKVRNLLDMDPIHRRAIKKVKHTRKVTTTGEGESLKTVEENYYEYDLWDKMNALDKLAALHKLIQGAGENADKPGDNVIIMLPQNRFSGKAIETTYKDVSVKIDESDSE